MALRDWQQALAQLVEARAAGRNPRPVLESLDGLDLREEERAWLRTVTGTPGFELTAYVPRWWRTVRVRQTARLTLAALGGSGEELLRSYLRAVPCFTLFYVTEGLAFIDHVLATAPALPHLHSVARFERALWVLKQAEPTPDAPVPEPSTGDTLVRHPAANLVTFEAPPEVVLGAVLTRAPLPAGPAEPHPVLVAPGLPRMWRPATRDEARAFPACAPEATVRALRALPGVTEETVRSLLEARALSLRT